MSKQTEQNHYDLVIIGTGAGGGTLAYALRNSGIKILMIERGDFLPQEPENWNPVKVWQELRYQTEEQWLDQKNHSFRPKHYYCVGGNTKIYGSALPRFRQEDFEEIKHYGGISPAWPISYKDLEPYYQQAEKLYYVHGSELGDSTCPPRTQPFPFPAIPHEPYIQKFTERLQKQGLQPSFLPMGIDLREGGRCVFCSTCECYPCQVGAKGDADICCVRPALETENIHLMTGTYAHRLLTDSTGERVVAVEVEQGGEKRKIYADTFIVSCGAINSAALFLRSANRQHPQGLANSSGLVGCNLMAHNVTFFVAFHLARANTSVFQKTWQINDFYWEGPNFPFPMGTIQANGKWPVYTLFPSIVQGLIKYLTDRRYLTLAAMSEDLPDPKNKVVLSKNNRIKIIYKTNNVESHQRLSQITRRILKQAGYPLLISKKLIEDFGEKTAHQCGTMCFGQDPATSVLDPFCKTHDLENLYCVDGSFFPSSSAQNPTLTIIAQALRVANHIKSCKLHIDAI